MSLPCTMEKEATLKRVRPREAVVPTRKKEGPISKERQEWMARRHAEALAAWEKEMAEEENKPPTDRHALQAAEFRESWDSIWCDDFGKFEDITEIPSMRFTDNPAPPLTAFVYHTLQIFSVKVVQVGGGLQWPLHVFGTVALRDAVDRRRNIIFNRGRDDCQILTRENKKLELTGPARAVVMLCPLTFEVELTVKGNCESEDKDLSYLAVPLIRPPLTDSTLLVRDYASKLSTVEFTHGHMFNSVEATVSVQIIGGSWLGYRGEFFACAENFDEEIMLLDSGDVDMPVTDDGKIKLSRKVVSVEHRGKLNIYVKAWHDGNFVLLQEKVFKAKEAGRSHGKFDVGFCKMHVTVAWSLITVDYNPKEKVL